ncbi:MAG: heme NO-binding domain-containing protein [Solirubrobacteraceae bacterium]
MLGLILVKLRQYVEAVHGPEVWESALEGTHQTGIVHRVSTRYGSEGANVLVRAVANVTGLQRNAILNGFGEFIAPDLLGMYRDRIPAHCERWT